MSAAQARQALVARSAAMQAAGYGKPKAQPKRQTTRPPAAKRVSKQAVPIVTEHTRGQARGGGQYTNPYTGRPEAPPAVLPVSAPFDLGLRHRTDRAEGVANVVAKAMLDYSGVRLLANYPKRFEHPLYDWNRPRKLDAQGRPIPLDKLPVSAGTIAIGPLKFGKAAADAEAAATNGAAPSPKLEPQAQVRAGLRGAKGVRGKQEAGYSAERAKRAQEAARIMEENPGIEGHRQALAALRGELPKINFGGFKELTPDALDALAKHVHEHPHVMPFQKITAVRALENAAEGRVPTNSEIKLLTNIFGKDTTAGLTKVHTLPDHIKNVVLETLNVPRSLMASFDLSAPFRQGLMAGARHPVIFGRNFKPMIRSFAKEGAYQQVENEIRSRPTFHMMHAAKLAITDLEPELTNREENLFGYGMAEKIPVAGRGVRASGRAYNAFLTKMRADVFDHLVKGFEEQGINVHDEEFLKGLGKYINASTGRGDLGHFQQAAPYLNTLFFSPRLLASRLNFMNPLFYARLPGPVRAEALRSAVQLTGLVTTMLGLAALGGAKVGRDPRNADFGKIRVGNTRLDILGGFQQPIRLIAQEASGKIISSTTGDPLTLGPGIGHVSRRDIGQRFLEGKLAPVPSVVNDFLKGQDFQGKPFSWKNEAVSHTVPLLGQDASDLYHGAGGGPRGAAIAAGGYGVGAFGIGLQTYGPKDLTNKAIDDGRKRRNLLLVRARNHGLLGPHEELSDPVKGALRLQTVRQVIYAHAGAKTQADMYLADVKNLNRRKVPGVVSMAVAKQLVAGTLVVDGKPIGKERAAIEIRKARDYFGYHYYGGKTLRDVNRQINQRAAQGG